MNRQINRYHPLVFGALLLFLAACGQDAQPTASIPSTPGFSFSVNPAAGSVELETLSPELTVAAPAECDNGTRTLTPGNELKLADYTFAFLPGNILEIKASFTNTTTFTYEQPFTFSSTSATSNVVSTTEPELGDGDLGSDGKLSPNETTTVLTFTVEHKAQAFSYGVSAQAEVKCQGDPVDPIDPVDPAPADAVLTLSKSDGDVTAAPGDIITYTLNFENTSDFDSSPAIITETVPENTVFSKEASNNEPEWLCADASGPGTVCVLELGIIPANGGGSATFAVMVDKPIAEGVSEISNTATIQDNQPSEENPEPEVDDTASTTTPVIIPPEPNAALSLEKSDDDATALPGGTIVYTLSYENTSDFASKPATLYEALPQYTTFDAEASTAGWSCVPFAGEDEGFMLCTLELGVLAALEKSSATFTVTVDESLDKEVTEISNAAAIADQPFLEEEGGEPDSFAMEATPIVVDNTCDEIVSVPDSGLEQAIRNQLGKPEGELTCGDLASLQYLNPYYYDTSSETYLFFKINSLEGLEFAANLTSLQVYDSQLSDLSPLSGLTSLQYFYLSNTSVSDLSSLSGLTGLQTLAIDNTSVSDLSPLSGLTNLKNLYLSNTSVSDISILSELTGLQSLSLSDTSVSDLSPLAGLTSLQSLSLYNTSVSDISPLSGLTGLRYLSLYYTSVSDISTLSALTDLQSLNLGGTSISDIGVLSELTNLQTLQLSNTSVSDISALSGLTSLSYLYLYYNPISDISPLVTNSGLGDGSDVIYLYYSCLDLSTGSQAQQDIATLEDRNPNQQNIYTDFQGNAQCPV